MTPSDLTGLPDNILRKMVEEARAEAARQALLVQRYEPAYLGLPHVVRERDEARAEVERLRGYMTPGQIEEAETIKDLLKRWKAAEAKLAEAEAEHPTGVCLERELRAERDKLRRDLDRKDHEVAELQDKVEVLLNQNREIAASNADHVRWHREKVAEIERLREALAEVEAVLARALEQGGPTIRVSVSDLLVAVRSLMARAALRGGGE